MSCFTVLQDLTYDKVPHCGKFGLEDKDSFPAALDERVREFYGPRQTERERFHENFPPISRTGSDKVAQPPRVVQPVGVIGTEEAVRSTEGVWSKDGVRLREGEAIKPPLSFNSIAELFLASGKR